MLEAVALSKSFNGHEALSGLDLSVEPGEVFCLLGANGAGKSTTIHLFLGFLEPSSGQALVDGLDVAAQPLETKRRLAYIPEQVQLYPSLTGLEDGRFRFLAVCVPALLVAGLAAGRLETREAQQAIDTARAADTRRGSAKGRAIPTRQPISAITPSSPVRPWPPSTGVSTPT